MGGVDKGGGGQGNGLTIEVENVSQHSKLLEVREVCAALKVVFSKFGDVLDVPLVDRGMDSASVRFATAESAEAAKNACDLGQVFSQGFSLKVKWPQGCGPRVGNSDIGGAVGGSSPTRRLADDGDGKGGGRGIRDRSRSCRRRDDERGAGRDRWRDEGRGRRDDDTCDRRRDRDDAGGYADAFNPMGDARLSVHTKEVHTKEVHTKEVHTKVVHFVQMQQQSQPQAPQRMTAAEMEAADMAVAQVPQALPEPVHSPTAEEIEAEARRRQEMKDNRAAQLKRGSGVAGALKRARTSIEEAIAENEFFMDPDKEMEKKRQKLSFSIRKAKAELDAEGKLKDEDDAAEKTCKEDVGKVVFLDIDGVLRPARAGGFDVLSEGKESVNPDTSDFFPSAMKALCHIMKRTGAIVVLSSEWRRNEALREKIDAVLKANGIRPSFATTPVNVDEVKMSDPLHSFADQRAREVTAWLEEHQESVEGWVVLDDINLALADEKKKASTKSMGPKLVQTLPLCGLTMDDAKRAVLILNGENAVAVPSAQCTCGNHVRHTGTCPLKGKPYVRISERQAQAAPAPVQQLKAAAPPQDLLDLTAPSSVPIVPSANSAAAKAAGPSDLLSVGATVVMAAAAAVAGYAIGAAMGF